jgi:hypothetical protein
MKKFFFNLSSNFETLKVNQRYENSLVDDPNLMLTISLTNILILNVRIN